MNRIIRKLKEPWDFMRIIRVVFGGYIIGAGLFYAQYFGLLIGGFLLYQGIMNIGCFGTACVSPIRSKNHKEPDGFQYEKIKSTT